jgi:ABC-type phosphate/phosphonate transport system ATPase subunit
MPSQYFIGVDLGQRRDRTAIGIIERSESIAERPDPVKNLIDYLERGHSLGEFLGQFPTVTRDMAIQALEEAKESLLARIA